MSLNVSFGRKRPAVWFRSSYSHHVFNQVSGHRLISCSTAGAVCRASGWTGGLVPVAPPAQGHEWAPSGRGVSGGWDAARKESGTYCCTWPRPPRPPSCCPRCPAGSGGKSRATGTFSVGPSSSRLRPAAPVRPPSASSTSSWRSNTTDELLKQLALFANSPNAPLIAAQRPDHCRHQFMVQF